MILVENLNIYREKRDFEKIFQGACNRISHLLQFAHQRQRWKQRVAELIIDN